MKQPVAITEVNDILKMCDRIHEKTGGLHSLHEKLMALCQQIENIPDGEINGGTMRELSDAVAVLCHQSNVLHQSLDIELRHASEKLTPLVNSPID